MDATELYRERFLALSTPQVSDALEPFGVVSGLRIHPAVRGRKVFGPAFTVAKQLNDDPSFRDAADFVDDVPGGQVIVIDNLGLESSTCWGGILTHYAIRKGIRGTVINGLNRDIDEIAELDYPLFSKGSFMVTGKGRTRLKDVNVPITIDGVTINPGDFMFGDDNGVVMIPAAILDQLVERAEEIRNVENDIVDMVLNGDVSLREARKRLRYADLTRGAAAK